MQTQNRPIKCKYCNEDIVFNNDIRAFVWYGGENDGLIHKDARTGSTIVSTSTDVKRILEEILMLRSEVDRLRTTTWDNGQKIERILSEVTR